MRFPIIITEEIYNKLLAERQEELEAENYRYVYEADVVIDFVNNLREEE